MNIAPLFEKHGRNVEVYDGNGSEISKTSAFISPLRYKNKMYLYGVNTEIGYNSQGHYLYIGPPDVDLSLIPEGGYIVCENEKYRIDRAEKVYKGNNVFYIRAIVRVIVEIEEE